MNKLLPLMSLLVAGCTTLIPANPNPHTAKSLPERVVAAVDVSGEQPMFSISVDEDLDENETQLTVVSENGESLNFKYFRSELNADKKHDVIFLYNILKDKKEYFLSRKWTRPVLPDPDNPHLSYDEYNTYLAQSVGRIIKYWIPSRASLSGRYGFVGVSLGGIHAIAAAAIFPDSIMTIAIMAGGDNVDLFKGSQEDLVIENRKELLEKYKTPEELYRQITNLKFRVLEMARCIDTSKIKLMITLDDTSVPTACQWRLFYALGGPEARLFPCGHYSMALYYFAIKEQLQDWMVEAFQG
jgi:pimeloyl-ACP methyl ester carboxylesterase